MFVNGYDFLRARMRLLKLRYDDLAALTGIKRGTIQTRVEDPGSLRGYEVKPFAEALHLKDEDVMKLLKGEQLEIT